MKRRKFLDFEIAELNTRQVRELIEFGQSNKGNSDPKFWEDRQWRTILLSLNNAAAPPTKSSPLGSDSYPQSREDIEPSLGFASFNEMRDAVMDLSGLRVEPAGESAAAEKN